MCIISLIPHNHPGKQIPRYHQRSTLWKRSGIQTGCPGVFSEQIPRSGFLEQKLISELRQKTLQAKHSLMGTKTTPLSNRDCPEPSSSLP
ncbi:uncharacterized protein LOC144294659 isoform X4 [Canis aureus]